MVVVDDYIDGIWCVLWCEIDVVVVNGWLGKYLFLELNIFGIDVVNMLFVEWFVVMVIFKGNF